MLPFVPKALGEQGFYIQVYRARSGAVVAPGKAVFDAEFGALPQRAAVAEVMLLF